jgi:fucose 4-O-acetylase-like acetyltransferase
MLVAALAAAYAWDTRRGGAAGWSPLQQLGRSSLFIYWIHVEMVYGLVSLRLQKSLSFGEAGAALTAFAVFMLVCAIVKERAVDWWQGGTGLPQPGAGIADAGR